MDAATMTKVVEVITFCGEPEVSVSKQRHDRKVGIDFTDLEFFGIIKFFPAESFPAGSGAGPSSLLPSVIPCVGEASTP
jgi:hypothetical protein